MGAVHKFSVIIPTHNNASFVKTAVASVLKQRHPAFEIIVVDDGSTDETAAILAGFNDKLLYLRKANGGPGSARNTGLEHARGDYIVFLDSDDILLPWALATYAEIIKRCGEPAFILSRPFAFTQTQPRVDQLPLAYDSWDDYLQAAPARYPVSIAAAVRTRVLQRHGFTLPSKTSEDQDLYLRMGEEKGFVFVQTPQLYAYRVNQDSLTFNMTALQRGLSPLLANERKGVYPGGPSRQGERSIILSRIIKFILTRCLRYENYRGAYRVFLRSLPYLLRANHKAAYGLFKLLVKSTRGKVLRQLRTSGRADPTETS